MLRWKNKYTGNIFQDLPVISSWWLWLSIMYSHSQLIATKIWTRVISLDTNEYWFFFCVFLLQTQFDITVASEIMAILALTTDLQDMRTRFASYTFMFSCHVPFSQTTGNHVKPTTASMSFIHKTTPWNIYSLEWKWQD